MNKQLLDDPKKTENTIANILVSYAPFIGPIIQGVLQEHTSDRERKRIIEFVKDVEDELKKNFENEYLKKSEFEYLLRECLKGAAEHYQKQKLICFRGIIINSLRNTTTIQDEKEYYLYLVNNLTELHLRILALNNNPQNYFEINEISIAGIEKDDFNGVILRALKGIDIEVIKTAWQDLYRFRLVSGKKELFGTGMTNRGFDAVRYLSPLGQKFVKFCAEY